MQNQLFRHIICVTIASLILSACASSGIVPKATIDSKANDQWNKIIESVPQSQNAQLVRAVQQITVNLLAAAGENPAEWRIAIFEAPDTFNAFALPNKRIGVFTGLINNVDNADQLAAVIGHEIAHVELSHVEARVNRAVAPNVLIGVAKLPGQVLGVPVVKQAGDVVGGVVSAGAVLPYNRNQEIEADTVGVEYAFKAGYDPRQAAELWRKVSEAQGHANRMTPEFLSTHPSSEHRIRELDKAVDELLGQ